MVWNANRNLWFLALLADFSETNFSENPNSERSPALQRNDIRTLFSFGHIKALGVTQVFTAGPSQCSKCTLKSFANFIFKCKNVGSEDRFKHISYLNI